MNDAEPVEFVVVGLFGNGGGDYFLPAMKRVASSGTEIDDGEVDLEE